jgi:hypothetical protein
MSREPDVFITRYQQRNGVVTGGKDGTAEWVPAFAITPHAVWAIVDVESGRYAIACPSGTCEPLQRSLNTTTFFRNNAVGAPKGLNIPLEIADVYLIRPKAGIWHASAGDGNNEDEDGSLDGTAQISMQKFVGYNSKAAPPDDFVKGDVLIIFQPMNLHFMIVEVAQ